MTSRQRPGTAAGYARTMVGSGPIGVTRGVLPTSAFRTLGWFGRGFRSPLRDCLLADEVGPCHCGRAYRVERTADMIGAVVGPLVAAALVAAGASVGA